MVKKSRGYLLYDSLKGDLWDFHRTGFFLMKVHDTQPNCRRSYGVNCDTSSVNPSNSGTCGSISLFPFLGVCPLAACVLVRDCVSVIL